MPEKNDKLEMTRHSLSHVLAAAVLKLFPKVKFAIGPAVDNGFYYDLDFEENTKKANKERTERISENDLARIEEEMKKIIKANLPFERFELPVAKALAREKKSGQAYKLELVKDLKKEGEKVVSYYKLGEFEDLCRGPHLKSSGQVQNGSWKLDKLAGAYWRGSEKNKMLVRIYGLAFLTIQELENYVKMMAEAEKRDHRKLGKDLDLFVFSEIVGKGLPLLTPKGTVIRKELEKYVLEEETKRGYQHVITPSLAKVELFKKSGHYPYYKDTMYPIMKVDEEELILRPMTCPHHFELYNSRPRSYKELPVRLAEISPQFRYEKSGELSGLTRVRMFCLADAHIICAKDQAETEIKNVLDLIDYSNKIFGLEKIKDYRYRLSLGDRHDDKKYYKDDVAWDNAEGVLRNTLKKIGAPYFEAEGEAAFYGPKIDVQMKKINGQEETAFTVQYDFVMPKRFAMKYVDRDGKENEPIVIHRSSIGCFERTMAFLIEHYAGAFPVWLAPVQVKIVSVGATHVKFCRKLSAEFKENNIRVEVDETDETVGNKIRKAVGEKVPYMLVVGDREMNSDPSAGSGQAKLAVRDRGEKQTREIGKKEFIAEVTDKIKTRK
ncbi:MAG: Threonine-tRNA ligase [Parcubacteria group bacterium GW2011_GWC2_42_12]|uniref:Threonine--tRNA ligase n=1 Tax=Candidatus Falkowbacteria bacterium RIFCSPHIGHO2_02_FULL_42_9 TaxID=1797986 RepID=A0A1F5S6P7_9BACT|nr:MAG: Threonine-tRNA ligase [Parcubacteria group bacterium GW2011_GWC2_42_12]OGF22232.1 MAG: threonine--tRNA ligase [Candidatus Falkowbacteria bacterium RIFCSPHIGHO2_02_FULL_42_9]